MTVGGGAYEQLHHHDTKVELNGQVELICQCHFSTIPNLALFTDFQGVVTSMSCVEAFATGIKIESSNQSPFGGLIKNQGDL